MKKEDKNLEVTSEKEEITETPKVENPIKEEPLNNKVVESFSYDSPELENIENKRKEFLHYYKNQNLFKWVVGGIGIILIIIAWIVIPNFGKNSDGTAASWALPAAIIITVVSLGAIFVYSTLTKKSLNRRMRDYFLFYYNEMKDYCFGNDQYESADLLVPDKLERIQFDENKLYENVFEVGSRGLTEIKYKGKLMMVCDCAAQVKGDKRVFPVFVGKYIVAPSSYNEADPIFVYVKGDKRSLPPTAISGYKPVLDDKDIVIYSNYGKWNKVINSKVLAAIKKISVGKQLVDVAISLSNGKVYMCLGYDDPVMVLPLEHAFDPSPSKEVKSHWPEVMAVIEELNK